MVTKLETYYVTATWHDWPEGGSCGELIVADSSEAAEDRMMDQMVGHLEGDDYRENWHIVDCYSMTDQILGVFDQLLPAEQQIIRDSLTCQTPMST